jgi:pimeloyl-ACP methyl ester carboxylesterase
MEKVVFENTRGREIHGVFESGDSDRCIVMAHGLTDDRNVGGYFSTASKALNEAGFNVLRFDFTGRGDTEGKLTLDKGVDDLKSAIEFVKSRGINRIGLYGYSMGGVISLRSLDPSIEAVFLSSPVTARFELPLHPLSSWLAKKFGEVPDINIDRKRKIEWVNWELTEDLLSVDQKKLLSDIDVPVKIVHGNRDFIVDVENSKKASKILNCELEIIDGMGHTYRGGYRQEVIDEAEAWFREEMPER